uniref:cysteine dioxygenase n=1 Tax=Oryza sativa subsp. japonica TaxID=39947 RepID=Q5ZA02_ORYSJ|nr:HGWP repeat containing protein-like [Oryza sativa Japonica Group]
MESTSEETPRSISSISMAQTFNRMDVLQEWHRPPGFDSCLHLSGRSAASLLRRLVLATAIADSNNDFTTGLPPSPPAGVIAYTVGRPHHRSWASTSSPTGLPSSPPTGVSAYTAGLLCRRCWASTTSPTGSPSSPLTGVSACTAGLLCRRCWASTTSPPACLRRRRLVSSPIRSVGHTTVDGHRHLHCRPASVAADWCHRLYGWSATPPFMGVHVFTDRLAFVAADWCLRLHGWPIMPPLLGFHDFTDRLAFIAADWCLRLHGWPVMPPLLGVYDFTTSLPPSPPTGVIAYTVAVGRLRLHHRLAVVAADWCLRLYGRLVTPPLMGIVIYTAGLPPSPPTGVPAYTVGWSHHRSWASTSSPTGWPSPTGVSACTAGLLCRRCWMSTSSPLAHLRCRRLVFPLTRLAYYAAVSGHLRFHRRPPSSPPTGVFIVIDGRLCSHIGHFCHHQGEYYKAKSSFILFFI